MVPFKPDCNFQGLFAELDVGVYKNQLLPNYNLSGKDTK